MSTLQALRASHGSVVAAKEPWLAEVLGNIDLVGLRCWRIEALHPVAVATDSLGSFYDGDSYFVLSSVQRTRVDFRGRVNEVGGTVQAVHVWQGPSSSIDERAIAAIKAQELVRALRGLPTLTREESGHEGPAFLALFKRYGGFTVLSGGVASGFTATARAAFEPCLLHCKGKRSVVTRQVPLSARSLNDGDVFLLDVGSKIFLWAGRTANVHERAKGMELLARLAGARKCAVERIIVEDATPEEVAEFWGELGGSAGDVAPALPDDDEGSASLAAPRVTLHRLSDASGALATNEIPRSADGLWRLSQLPKGDVAIVDVVGGETFVWVSRGASDAERASGPDAANAYLAASGRSASARVTVVREGGESPLFLSLFAPEPRAPLTFGHVSRGVAGAAGRAALADRGIDFSKLAAGASAVAVASADARAAPLLRPTAQTTTALEQWAIRGSAIEAVPPARVGELYASCAYVVVHSWEDARRVRGTTIYYWIGKHAASLERGTSALTARDKADLHRGPGKGSVALVRVVQGSEPPAFCRAFAEGVVVHSGAAAGMGAAPAAGVRLYHVKGSSSDDTRAFEVTPVAGSLNSGDAFVLVTIGGGGAGGAGAPPHALVWMGAGANDSERDAARRLGARLVRAWRIAMGFPAAGGDPPAEITEGDNDDDSSAAADFWLALGGRTPYAMALAPEGMQLARFFVLSDALGVLRMEEVQSWSQEDLIDDDVCILDTGSVVYVWVGGGASARERKEALPSGEAYVAAAVAAGRPSGDAAIVVLDAGGETPDFIAQFADWEAPAAVIAGRGTIVATVDPYAARLAELKASEAAAKSARADAVAVKAAARTAAVAAAEAQRVLAKAGGGGGGGNGSSGGSGKSVASAAASVAAATAAATPTFPAVPPVPAPHPSGPPTGPRSDGAANAPPPPPGPPSSPPPPPRPTAPKPPGLQAQRADDTHVVLLSAIAAGDVAGVARLLSAGTNPLACRPGGATALHAAAVVGNVVIVRKLLRAAAAVQQQQAQQAHQAPVVLLHATDERGRTALHIAAAGVSVVTVKELLAQGADVNALDAEGRTPLAIAAAQSTSGDVCVVLREEGGV